MAGEGSLSASLIPVFTGYLHDESQPKAWAFAQKVFWDVGLALAVIALLGAVFSRQIIGLLTIFGAHHGHWELAVYLNRIIFPSILFIGLAAVAASLLNSFHVFALPAATPIFFNLSLVACSFAAVYRPILRWAPTAYRSPAVALAVGILIGGLIQFLIQVPALLRRGMTLWPRFSVYDAGVRKVGRLAAPAFFGMGVYQINMFVDTIFAASSRMPEGSITSLYVADRVMQLVLGSYAIAMSTALLPTMSHQWASGQWSEMKRTFGFSLRIVSFITVPAAIGLILLRQPIIQVLFQHGRFTSGSTALTARALLYYSLGLPAFAGVKLIAPMYYSTRDTATPARTGAYALGLNIVLNITFLLFFFRTLSNGSPALASSIAAYFNFGALFFLFRKRYGRLGARGLLQSFWKIAACAAGTGFAAYTALRFSDFEGARTVIMQIGLLAGIIAAAVAAYFALAWLLRCEELGEFFLLLRKSEPATAPITERV